MSAFEELYKRYYSQVYFYVLGLCRNEHIAEEITQETFLKVLKKMDTFKGESDVMVSELPKGLYHTGDFKALHHSQITVMPLPEQFFYK